MSIVFKNNFYSLQIYIKSGHSKNEIVLRISIYFFLIFLIFFFFYVYIIY